MVTAIILAGGKSTRMGAGMDKAFLSLVNKPVVAWSLIAFERSSEIDRIVLVVRKDQLLASKAVVRMFGISKLQTIVAGGARRQDSVQAGLKACDADTRHVIIHDAARPCITSDVINELVKQVKRFGAVTVGRPVIDTLKRAQKGKETKETVDRDDLYAVQTPQGFQFRLLRDAYKALDSKAEVTDDAQVLEKSGTPVKIMDNLKPNIKITTPEDMQLASAWLK